MTGKSWSTMSRVGGVFLLSAAISSCVTAGRHVSQERLVGVLSAGLDVPSVPKDCVYSLRVRSKVLQRISGVVDQLPEGARYGVYARLGGSYLYSRFIVLIPHGQLGAAKKGYEWEVEIPAAQFEALRTSVSIYRGGVSGRSASHDECNLLYVHAPDGDRSAVVLSSDVEGLDSVPLSEMYRAFDLVVAHLEKK